MYNIYAVKRNDPIRCFMCSDGRITMLLKLLTEVASVIRRLLLLRASLEPAEFGVLVSRLSGFRVEYNDHGDGGIRRKL